MDFSKEYVLMCERAKEIQQLAQYNNTLKDFWTENEQCWLPRQDQLQEMIRDGDTLGEFLLRFDNFLNNGYKERIDPQPLAYFDSFEQLWFAFVMKEKFNKTWNPENKEWEENNA